MRSPVSISLSEARRIILDSQKLTKAHPFGSSSKAVIKAVEHLGYVQVDTISVVERAHHHVLWSRIPEYQSAWINKVQQRDRMVFEYWAHAAAYLPMSDYRFSFPVMKHFRDKKDRWPKITSNVMKDVLERIRSEGPLKSRDFESAHKGKTWWDWKPEKWALQRLFLEGHLMVSHREGFQRVYDLPERIIPDGIRTDPPSMKEYYKYLILTTLRAQGLASKNEISHLRQTDVKKFNESVDELFEDGKIIQVRPENQKLFFTLPHLLQKKIRLAGNVHVLSPFDNLVIWRKRMKEIFNFDYTLECYVPASKRMYGYFCLPVLYKDKFIGRIDAKADRNNKTLKVTEFWELNELPDIELRRLYNRSLKKFATFNGCNKIDKKINHFPAR